MGLEVAQDRILCHWSLMYTLLLFSLFACTGTTTAPEVEPATQVTPATEARVAKASPDTVRAALTAASGHVRVFNFWATWCQPCIVELPHLARLQKERPEVEVMLVSLDHVSIGTGPVLGFLKSRELYLQSFMLDAEDPAMAMSEVYHDFPAAIPVTLVIDAQGEISKAFHRGVTYADLTEAVDEAM